jgi:hypothetical protein
MQLEDYEYKADFTLIIGRDFNGDALKVDGTEFFPAGLPDANVPADAAATVGGNDAKKRTATGLARLLQEHNGGNVVVIDLRQLSMWTDFFVIATITSAARLSGLQRRIKEFADENNLPILRRPQENGAGRRLGHLRFGFYGGASDDGSAAFVLRIRKTHVRWRPDQAATSGGGKIAGRH